MERELASVGEVARRAGVSVRTLRYYDSVGLLHPAAVSAAGYRMYGRAELERLGRILLLRELDFSLEQIAALIDTGADAGALRRQRELLCVKRNRLDRIIASLDAMLEGGCNMDLSGFDNAEFESRRDEYAREAEARWGGGRAWAQHEARTGGYSRERWSEVTEGLTEVLCGFAALREGAPDATEARAQVERWRDYITANFYDCTPDIMRGLADMYLADERFCKNIDRSGEGTAEFIARAVKAYLDEENG